MGVIKAFVRSLLFFPFRFSRLSSGKECTPSCSLQRDQGKLEKGKDTLGKVGF